MTTTRSPNSHRRIFVAGSTGAVGRTVMRLGDEMALDLVPHRRPKSASAHPPDPRAAILDLSDHDALVEALRGCTTVLQLIGTMRKRFATGDTYETSDIGTTRQLVDAAKEAGVDHVVFLGSLGTGTPVGPYLKAKARAEAIVREGGIPWTILRPSAFEGEGHPHFPGVRAVTRALGLHAIAPIRVEDLARAILEIALMREPLGEVVSGRQLWEIVERARSRAGSLERTGGRG